MVTCTTAWNLRDRLSSAPDTPACTTVMDYGVAMTPLPRWGRTEDWQMHKKQDGFGFDSSLLGGFQGKTKRPVHSTNGGCICMIPNH